MEINASRQWKLSIPRRRAPFDSDPAQEAGRHVALWREAMAVTFRSMNSPTGAVSVGDCKRLTVG